jgi:hypothetical protein
MHSPSNRQYDSFLEWYRDLKFAKAVARVSLGVCRVKKYANIKRKLDKFVFLLVTSLGTDA